MQPRRPQRLPLQGYLYGIIGVSRLPVIVPLIQANTLTPPKVYGWDYFYFKTSQINIGILPPRSGHGLIFQNVKCAVYDLPGIAGHNNVINMATLGSTIGILE